MMFEKHFDSYDDNAIVQKKVIKNLKKYFKKLEHSPKTILEIGCGTGLLSKELLSLFPSSKLILNDLFDTREFLTSIPFEEFIQQDAEQYPFGNYDLITSSGSFQWFQDFKRFLNHLPEHTNQLVFSIFLEGNLKEIQEHFGISLEYLEISEIVSVLKALYSHVEYEEEVICLEFPTPLAALQHLKSTGVTGIGNTSIAKIRNYPHRTLSYRVGYFLATK